MPIYPQAPNSVVMIRPHNFCPNPETLEDNSFQSKSAISDPGTISQNAYQQVTEVEKQLNKVGIKVHVFEDTGTATLDSVFPNNWFSTHAGGHVALYPMYAQSRRKERRTDIIDFLKQHYRVQDVVDYSGLEYDHIYLEGTGAMVLDNIERVAYAARSKRTNSLALERFCTDFNYEPVMFDAFGSDGLPVYHTNVLMCIGSDFVMAGFDMITDAQRREEIIQRFKASGREIIPLTTNQIGAFCGNAFELSGNNGRYLALSKTAFDALTYQQKKVLQQSVTLLPLDVSTLELAGGSIRCMLAGIHLSAR